MKVMEHITACQRPDCKSGKAMSDPYTYCRPCLVELCGRHPTCADDINTSKALELKIPTQWVNEGLYFAINPLHRMIALVNDGLHHSDHYNVIGRFEGQVVHPLTEEDCKSPFFKHGVNHGIYLPCQICGHTEPLVNMFDVVEGALKRTTSYKLAPKFSAVAVTRKVFVKPCCEQTTSMLDLHITIN